MRVSHRLSKDQVENMAASAMAGHVFCTEAQGAEGGGANERPPAYAGSLAFAARRRSDLDDPTLVGLHAPRLQSGRLLDPAFGQGVVIGGEAEAGASGILTLPFSGPGAPLKNFWPACHMPQ